MRRYPLLPCAALAILSAGRLAEARHFEFEYVRRGHAVPIVGYEGTRAAECEAACDIPPPDIDSKAALDDAQVQQFMLCIRDHKCQPLIAEPPSLDPAACLAADAVTDLEAECRPFTKATTPSKRACCLQYEIAQNGWRGYQLRFGPYFMSPERNDEFTTGYTKVPNAQNLEAEKSTYEYMVGFEFWQLNGSHHFIMDDLLGPYNDPNRPRGSCSEADVCDPGDSASACNTKKADCTAFKNLAENCPAETGYDSNGNPTSGPRYNPKTAGACDTPSGMNSFPTAGSPGPSYFPVPYPKGVGIPISKEHIFRMTHHVQDWYDPQLGQVWINIYTVPAKKADGSENVDKEAHVFFDGSGSVFLVPPHTIGRTHGQWIAPRDILLYGLTFHSHKRNILATADLVDRQGNVRDLNPRNYPFSHPYCGGCSNESCSPRPMHLYETTDWAHHEQCPYWYEDADAEGFPDNDPEGAIFIRQGEGIRYECFVNNGVLPAQAAKGAGRGDVVPDALFIPSGALAVQSVRVEPRDAFGNVVRVKYSCEEIPGVIPGFPGAGAVGYYSNRPCLPDTLEGKEPSEDLTTPDTAQAALHGADATECCHLDPNDTSPTCDRWTQFRQSWFSGEYTGKCVPSSIGFAETEDDEMCILLGLYSFAGTDAVPSPIDRLPTDVGR